MDKLTKERRSALMRCVRGKNTAPETTLRSLIHRLGYRFRLHTADLPGRPDIVFRRHRAAIFVHGCFWHRHHRCSRTTMPKTRVDFWRLKFAANVRRDRSACRSLRRSGWRVLVVWECELKNTKRVTRMIRGFLENYTT